MNDVFVFAGHNTLVAIVLALFVYGLTRDRRNPPLSHVLWLLVLVKLVTPPVLCFEWPALRLPGPTAAPGQIIADLGQIESARADTHPFFADRPLVRTTVQSSAVSLSERDFGTSVHFFWNRGRLVLLWFWLGGSGLCALVAVTRISLFERHLQGTLPASERLQRLALQVAGKLGVGRVPCVRYVDCALVPFLWCAGRRATIVLPLRLMRQLDDQSSELILAHELAHLRRRDHWVRALELIVLTVYWWNPLAWLIRRQIHQAEDLCCDAWVRSVFPGRTKRYAEVVLKTAESLNARQVRVRWLPASPFLQSLSLKARIELILESRFAPRLSSRSRLVVALFAILVIPSFILTTRIEARGGSTDGAPAAPAQKLDRATTSELPHAIQFDQGATRFVNGDEITVTEVRGTAETFEPGNIYWIKGTYTLASHDRATLAAYITAMDAEHGTSPSLKIQTTVVKKGNGTFTLFLPMSYRGWPHVSFYPAEGGSDFGGNYFGTGDSVLKRWWGSKQTDSKSASTPARSKVVTPATPASTPANPTDAEFPHAVRFDQGVTKFLNSDKITITEVRGTADTFVPGNTYWIKGNYTLASHDRATLAAYISAMDAENARSRSLKTQRTVVDQGNGTFTLVLPMSYRGWPHVSFYPATGGSAFGGTYFGTGDYVLKR